MDPPTRQAPPDAGMDLSAGGQSAWVVACCSKCGFPKECRNFENWVFRKEHSEDRPTLQEHALQCTAKDYDAFLSVRNFEPAGILPGRWDSQKWCATTARSAGSDSQHSQPPFLAGHWQLVWIAGSAVWTQNYVVPNAFAL
eukprot:2984604-Amphidinium_carterae.1